MEGSQAIKLPRGVNEKNILHKVVFMEEIHNSVWILAPFDQWQGVEPLEVFTWTLWLECQYFHKLDEGELIFFLLAYLEIIVMHHLIVRNLGILVGWMIPICIGVGHVTHT